MRRRLYETGIIIPAKQSDENHLLAELENCLGGILNCRQGLRGEYVRDECFGKGFHIVDIRVNSMVLHVTVHSGLWLLLCCVGG